MAAAAAATSKNITTGRFSPQFQLVNAYAPRNSNYCAVQLYCLRNSPLWHNDYNSNDSNANNNDKTNKNSVAPFQWIRLPFLPPRYLKHHNYPEHIRKALQCAVLPSAPRHIPAASIRSTQDAPNHKEASSSPDNPTPKIQTNKSTRTASPAPPTRIHQCSKTAGIEQVVSNKTNNNNDNNNKDNKKSKEDNDVTIGGFRNPSGKQVELLRTFHNNRDETRSTDGNDVYFAGFRNPSEKDLEVLRRLFPELQDSIPSSSPTTSQQQSPAETKTPEAAPLANRAPLIYNREQPTTSNQHSHAGTTHSTAALLANSASLKSQREQSTIAAPLANRAPLIFQREQPTIAAPLANRAPLNNREQPTTTAPNSFRQALNSDHSAAHRDSDDDEDPAPESTATLRHSLNPFDCSIQELKIQWEKNWREMAHNQLTAFIHSMTHPEFTLPDDDAWSIESTTFPNRSTIGIKPTTEKRHHPHTRRKPTRKHSQHNQHSRPHKTTSWKNPVRASFVRRPHFRSTPPSTTTPRKQPPAEYSPSPSTAPVPTRFDGYAPNPRPSIWNKPVSYKHEPPDTLATGIREL